MGLVHSLADFDAFRSATPELLSPVELRRRPSNARRFAGTEDDVFFYVGPPMRVPEGGDERPGVIIFRADIETSDMLATPWDSGGIHRRRAQQLSDVQRKALLDSRTMPAPDYRRALAATLLLRFDGSPESYLRGHIAQPTDPDGVYDGEPSSFTYETRVRRRIGIQIPELALVAVRREFLYINEGVPRLRGWCMERKVPFEVVDEQAEGRCVRDVVLDFAIRSLRTSS
jgi:hypothetical protein